MPAPFLIDSLTSWRDNLTYSHFEHFLLEASQGKKSWIVFDCEGSPYLNQEVGTLCIVQLCYEFENISHCCIFDIVSCKELLVDKNSLLRQVLEHSNIIKWIHDGRRDCESIFFQTNVLVQSVLDTQYLFQQLVTSLFHDTSSINYKSHHVYVIWYKACLLGGITCKEDFLQVTWKLWKSLYFEKQLNSEGQKFQPFYLAKLIYCLCFSSVRMESINFLFKYILEMLWKQTYSMLEKTVADEFFLQVRDHFIQLIMTSEYQHFPQEFIFQHSKNVIQFIGLCCNNENMLFFGLDHLENFLQLILSYLEKYIPQLKEVLNPYITLPRFIKVFEKYGENSLWKSADEVFYFPPEKMETNITVNEEVMTLRIIRNSFNSVSLIKLLEVFCNINYADKQEARVEVGENANYWKMRPFTDKMLAHASNDVFYLIPLVKHFMLLFQFFNRIKVDESETLLIESTVFATCYTTVLSVNNETPQSSNLWMSNLNNNQRKALFSNNQQKLLDWRTKYPHLVFLTYGEKEKLPPRSMIIVIGNSNSMQLFLHEWREFEQRLVADM